MRGISKAKMDPKAVEEEVRIATAHIDFCASLCELQRGGGRYFVLEQPAGSAAWKVDSLAAMLARDDVHRVSFDMCRYGMSL